jgi:DNA-binding PadR family transcriptional regulator
MSVRYALLGLLSSKSMHGYELKSRFDEVTGGFWRLNVGQVYSTLERLEREHLIERAPEARGEAPERKAYRITPEGQTAFEEWMVAPVAQPPALRDDLFVRLMFCAPSSPEPIQAMINRQRDAYQLEMQKLARRKRDLDRLNLSQRAFMTDLLLDAALFHFEAELRWLSHLQQKLSSWGPKPHRPRRS